MEQIISILIFIHALFGGIALLAGLIALITKKGLKVHKKSGKVFYYAMLLSAITAIVIAIMPNHESPFLFSIGLMTSYFILTGYRILRYKKIADPGLFIDKIISWAMLITGTVMLLYPLLFLAGINPLLFVFGILIMVFSLNDLNLFYRRRELIGAKWLSLHISKMVSGYISTLTAFLVVNQLLPFYIGWFAPGIIGGFYIAYWIRKVTMNKRSIIIAPLLMLSGFLLVKPSHGQVYLEKQSRHRFAQLNLGIDYQMSTGGESAFISNNNQINSVQLSNQFTPRFIIGGTHFWGHADFLIAIPLTKPGTEKQGLNIQSAMSIETAFKYYPLRIEQNKLRPYIGLSFTPFFFKQENNTIDEGEGAELLKVAIPLKAGLTFNKGNKLIELGMTWNYRNEYDYYTSRSVLQAVTSPPLYFNLSFKYMLETTFSAEREWESGRTEKITQALAEKGKLNSWFFGIGMSSAFWLKQSDYNKSFRPFIPNYGISLMPDFTLGRYFHNQDINIAANYRAYTREVNIYGAAQELQRKSIGLEITKFLFDYHGFVPFAGPILSYESLQFEESFDGNSFTEDTNEFAYGLTFGWDIRPNRIQSWILRTNLRWYPKLELETNSQSIDFSNLEFNFIQLIIYPERMF